VDSLKSVHFLLKTTQNRLL